MRALLDIKQAATYAGLPEVFFRNQLRLGRGPVALKVSPRRTFFAVGDLEAWMHTWKHTTPHTPSGKCGECVGPHLIEDMKEP